MKQEIDIRNQHKDHVELSKIQTEALHSLAKNGTNHVIDKNHAMEKRNNELKANNGHVINGASLNSRTPQSGMLINDQKIPGSKIVGSDGKISTSQQSSILPPNQHARTAFLSPNIPQKQPTNRAFQNTYVSHDTSILPGGSNGRPSVIQHTARPGPPPIYGPPETFSKEIDPRKRQYPFGDPRNSIISERQPFPQPPSCTQ